MCLRILYGDKEAYLNKFKTCVRTRTIDNQKLGEEFYAKEHTKPLFNKHKIFTVQSLYFYHTLFSLYKIIKTHVPISLYSCFTRSTRKETLLITPQHSHHFIYKSSSLWNEVRNTTQFSSLSDFSASLSQVKTWIRDTLYRRQKLGDDEEWSDENFILS